MKIAMMSPWNAACSVSYHAESIGREWVKMGHELKVFAPIRDEKLISYEEEPYVTRCYEVERGELRWFRELYLDPMPFIEGDYDFFVIQSLDIMPIDKLLEIIPEIKKKAKIIQVIHEGYPIPYLKYYLIEPDAVVCFDRRYLRLLKNKYPEDKIHIIPFPCHPLALGDKGEAREKLHLPTDKKIVFTYEFSIGTNIFTLPAVAELAENYDLLYLFVSGEKKEILEFARDKYDFFEARYPILTCENIYSYLHAADVFLIYKNSANIEVSSMVHLCIGSGCPIVISEGAYTEDLGAEVFKYRDFDELRWILTRIFEGEEPDKEAIERFIGERAAHKVASQFLELFSRL
ncbi:MAG: glycosyltransferase family protein [Candidatus Methanospirareceae archaeon]